MSSLAMLPFLSQLDESAGRTATAAVKRQPRLHRVNNHMSSIPLPALHVNPPQQQDPMASVEKLVQLKSLMQGQQLQQGQIQEQQQQITDNHALTTAMKNWDPKTQSYDDLTHSVLKNGGSGNAALAIKQHALTVQKQFPTLPRKMLLPGRRT
jgi:hypothetical protein